MPRSPSSRWTVPDWLEVANVQGLWSICACWDKNPTSLVLGWKYTNKQVAVRAAKAIGSASYPRVEYREAR